MLGPLILAALLMYLLHPAVGSLRRRGLGIGASILVAYLLALSAAGVLVLAVAPVAARQGQEFFADIPRYVRHADELVSATRGAYLRAPLPSPVRRGIDREVGALGDFVTGAVTDAASGLVHVAPGLAAYALAPVVSYYALRDLFEMPDLWSGIFEPAHAVTMRRIAGRVDAVLGGYLRGQAIAAAMVAALVFAAMTALELPYAVLVAILAGVTDVVPYVGPFIGALPALVIAAGVSPAHVLLMALAIIAIHELEGSVLAPRILGRSAQLRPLSVILALMFGEGLAGFWGLVVAVPAAAVGRVLVRELFRWAVRPRSL